MRTWQVVSLAALAFGTSAVPAFAATINNHYEIDLDNYRACKVDANGNRLYTCYGSDVRSGSQFYLYDGTSNSVSVTSAGVVKARLEGLTWDSGTTTSFACPNYTCDLTVGSPTRYRCLTGPLAPNGACVSNQDCLGYMCVGGWHNGEVCDPAHPDTVCKSLANANGIATVVFSGNQNSVTFVNGVATRVLYGDNSDPANGCTKVCTLNTNASGIIDSNAVSCSLDPANCVQQGYQSVKVYDYFGKLLAIPGLGTAHATSMAWGIYDAATNGDVCRGGSPPADCAYDQ